MRTQLAKSLQTRCKAIKRAVAAFNTAAARLTPPREPLDWSQVSNYGFIEEFALLRNTRNDITEKPWVKPLFREMLKMRHRILRAQEEILRCNVEIRRVQTAIHDEAILFSRVLKELKDTQSLMYGPVLDFVVRRKAVNRALLKRIEQVHSLRGFTGERTLGVRLGTHGMTAGPDLEDSTPSTDNARAATTDGQNNDGDDDDDEAEEEEDVAGEEDDEVQSIIGRMEAFYSNLD